MKNLPWRISRGLHLSQSCRNGEIFEWIYFYFIVTSTWGPPTDDTTTGMKTSWGSTRGWWSEDKNKNIKPSIYIKILLTDRSIHFVKKYWEFSNNKLILNIFWHCLKKNDVSSRGSLVIQLKYCHVLPSLNKVDYYYYYYYYYLLLLLLGLRGSNQIQWDRLYPASIYNWIYSHVFILLSLFLSSLIVSFMYFFGEWGWISTLLYCFLEG